MRIIVHVNKIASIEHYDNIVSYGHILIALNAPSHTTDMLNSSKKSISLMNLFGRLGEPSAQCTAPLRRLLTVSTVFGSIQYLRISGIEPGV